MKDNQRVYLAMVAITLTGVLIASGNVSGAREFALLMPVIIAALWPRDRAGLNCRPGPQKRE